MALEDDIRILSGVGIFQEFTQEQLRLLAFGTEHLRLPAGRELYREGSPSDCAFVIIAGTVALFRDRDGQRTMLSSLGPKAILGEFALISGSRRLTSALAETDVELLRLNRSLFRRILEEYPEVAAALHRRISERLADMVSEIERIAPRFS
jgi:CRP-like cAMP-binding protein